MAVERSEWWALGVALEEDLGEDLGYLSGRGVLWVLRLGCRRCGHASRAGRVGQDTVEVLMMLEDWVECLCLCPLHPGSGDLDAPLAALGLFASLLASDLFVLRIRRSRHRLLVLVLLLLFAF